MSFPPPPLHHYGDSSPGHSNEGEDYEVKETTSTTYEKNEVLLELMVAAYKEKMYSGCCSEGDWVPFSAMSWA